MERRLFTLEEANYMVPWLERTFKRLVSSKERLDGVRERLTEIQREKQRRNGTFDQYTELNRMQAELDDMDRELQEIVDEITAQGIIIRDIPKGLVDFPHLRDGREVYLCWVGGEERIAYWHETDHGFDHRQPL